MSSSAREPSTTDPVSCAAGVHRSADLFCPDLLCPALLQRGRPRRRLGNGTGRRCRARGVRLHAEPRAGLRDPFLPPSQPA